VVQTTTRNIIAFKESSNAQVLSESVMEVLVQKAANHEAGFSMNETECEYFITHDSSLANLFPTTPDEGPEVTCTVKGHHDEGDLVQGLYTIPVTGTGNAGQNCNTLLDYPSLNDSCNWGKLNFGNSFSSRVAIPLYYDTEAEGVILPYEDHEGLGALDEFEILVRAPCIDDTQTDEQCGRYELKVDGRAHNIDEDKAVAFWQISAICDGDSCSISAWDIASSKTRQTQCNTEIYGTKINEYLGDSRWDITQEDYAYTPYEEYICDPLGNHPPTIADFLSASTNIDFPILQLSVVADEIMSENNGRIPYLEYQILTNVPIANPEQIYTVEISYEGQNYKLVKGIEQEKSLVDFAIQN
jgi:hypothetical protein